MYRLKFWFWLCSLVGKRRAEEAWECQSVLLFVAWTDGGALLILSLISLSHLALDLRNVLAQARTLRTQF